MDEKETSEQISSFDLLCGVLIEMKEKGLAQKDSFGNLVFPLGHGDKKKLHEAYYETQKEFPDEMAYQFLLRTTPYCEDLNNSLHILKVVEGVRWLDDGRPWFKDKEASNGFLDLEKIQNYESVKKVATSIVGKLSTN